MRSMFVVLVAIVCIFSGSARAAVVIGTGGPTGVYYQAGQALCDLLKAKDIACEAPSSGGSIANLKALTAGEATFAMVQSDWQFHAVNGSSKWDGPGMPGLRAVFSVYPEPIQVVVNDKAGIRTWYALKGKRINIGNPGAGSRQTFEEMLGAQKWKLSAFSAVSELALSKQVDAFCAGDFDAFVFAIGIPNQSIARAMTECSGMLIEPHRTITRKLVTAARPYYSEVKIPKGTYRDDQKAVDTFGVMATLVTMKGTDNRIVDTLVKAVFYDLAGFKSKHPAFLWRRLNK